MRILAAALLTVASPAIAAETETLVSTVSESTKISVEFRSELKSTDQGLRKETGEKAPDRMTTVDVNRVRLKMFGNITKDVEYKLRFNVLDIKADAVDYASLTSWMGPVGISIGRQKVMQGGWDQADEGYKTHIQGVYKDNLPFNSYEDIVAAQAKVAGKIQLQVLNDRTTASGGEWNKAAHPTWALGWQGDFDGVGPLLQLGSFDNNKSSWFDAGIKANVAGVKANLDYMMLNKVHKGAKISDGKVKEVKDAATSITLRAGYEIKDTGMPWVYVSTYDMKQADDKEVVGGSEDRKFNTVTVDAVGKKTFKFDDNGMSYGAGFDYMLGKSWTTYLAFVAKSGKYQKTTGADPKATEQKTETAIRLGCFSEI